MSNNLLEKNATSIQIIQKHKNLALPSAPNVDFYSGAVYYILKISLSFYTSIFAIARIFGLAAHRLEELITSNKIICLAYKSVMKFKE